MLLRHEVMVSPLVLEERELARLRDRELGIARSRDRKAIPL
ncbi:MAG: hypothetical protein R3234_06410 [Thermoanaerobaculia bacterium]|nr:hypothetical protein [Thermoanaerobaculia bacterium]